jgi:hypothetical protein
MITAPRSETKRRERAKRKRIWAQWELVLPAHARERKERKRGIPKKGAGEKGKRKTVCVRFGWRRGKGEGEKKRYLVGWD